MENLMRTRSLAAIVFVLLTGQVAMAHPGHWEHGGVIAGTLHPIFGYDHIIAALAIGFWAMRVGGKIRWMLPGAFLVWMFVSALMPAWISSSAAECGVMASIFVL